jgi:hypothetical protein
MNDVTCELAVDLDQLDEDDAAVSTVGLDAVDEELIAQLAGRARAGGLALTGEGGLLAELTKRLVEAALEGEITDHLGLWVPRTLSRHATCMYSCMRPPSRSRRNGRMVAPERGGV